MRLAWFSPWPPQPTGVAGRSAELVPRLAARGHAIDVFVDGQHVPVGRAAADAPAAGRVRVLDAHEFVWRQLRGFYELPVFQLGNSSRHAFLWPYLFRWPGLAVLHDARLHHARGECLLLNKRAADYRAEFIWSHPDASADLAELGVHGFSGVYYYQWPMTRAVVESARLIGVHARGALAELQAAWPDRQFEYLALGEGRETPVTPDRIAAVRAGWHFPDDAVVFGVFGGLTAEKRIDATLEAFAAARPRAPHARLVLAGAAHPHLNVEARIEALGLRDVTRLLGTLDDTAFNESVAAVDVALNLRWPSSLETSGPWLRALAASRPTVITDLVHLAHVPTLDPRTWHRHAPAASGPDADLEAIAVAVDILDEVHSVRLAIEMLATNAPLRARLGRAARAYWEREHTVTRMADDYERLMADAAMIEPPESRLIEHLRPDALAPVRDAVSAFGRVTRETLDELS